MPQAADKCKSWILILPRFQKLYCFQDDALSFVYPVSTALNGLGEIQNSQCTPRGWHQIHQVIGKNCPLNSVFVGRVWTQEIYSAALAQQFPHRDWILTRILWLDGLEPGRNKGGNVDSCARFIYIHGTPEPMPRNTPLSHGCIRMRNQDIIHLSNWVTEGTKVYIHNIGPRDHPKITPLNRAHERVR